MSDRFAEGVTFVDLSPLNDPRLVVASTAHALGVREGGTRWSASVLHDAIEDREVLLVLDNFEHLLLAAAIGGLLGACPELHVLVTSREPLGLRWERDFAVAPLPVLPEDEPSSAAESGRSKICSMVAPACNYAIRCGPFLFTVGAG